MTALAWALWVPVLVLLSACHDYRMHDFKIGPEINNCLEADGTKCKCHSKYAKAVSCSSKERVIIEGNSRE